MVYVFLAFIVFVAGFWWFPPILSGLPWRPTGLQRTRQALLMANVQPGERVYDLGCGDGRVVVMAAREFKAEGVGVEISPLHCLASWVLAWRSGVAGQVNIIWRDFHRVSLREADVVFAYMTTAQAPGLRQYLAEQLQPGARVVTISFDLDGWEPQVVDRAELIFLYSMPPRSGSLQSFLEKELA